MTYTEIQPRETAFKTLEQGIAYFDPFQAEPYVALADVPDEVTRLVWRNSTRGV